MPFKTLAISAALLSLVALDATAQAWPARAITIVNPAAAGGSNEVIKAIVFDRLALALGVPVVMESKGGGGGAIGATYVAGAPADGYTLLFAGASVMATGPVTQKSSAYDPVRDFTPIAMLVDATLMLVVNKAVPASDAREFVKLARAQPGRLNYGSYGPGSTSMLGYELFKSVADIEVVHVPYRGAAPLLAAVLGGQVESSFDFPASVRAGVESGALRILGVAAATRSRLLPDVPTLAEQGYPVEASGLQMLVGPAGLPPAVVARLNAEINRILVLPEVRQRLGELGYDVVGGTPEQATRQVAKDLAKWSSLVRTIRFEPQ